MSEIRCRRSSTSSDAVVSALPPIPNLTTQLTAKKPRAPMDDPAWWAVHRESRSIDYPTACAHVFRAATVLSRTPPVVAPVHSKAKLLVLYREQLARAASPSPPPLSPTPPPLARTPPPPRRPLGRPSSPGYEVRRWMGRWHEETPRHQAAALVLQCAHRCARARALTQALRLADFVAAAARVRAEDARERACLAGVPFAVVDARRRLADADAPARVVQAALRRCWRLRRARRETGAATRVQRAWRRWAARRQLVRLREARRRSDERYAAGLCGDAAAAVQRLWRATAAKAEGLVERRRAREETRTREAAVTAQCFVRCARARGRSKEAAALRRYGWTGTVSVPISQYASLFPAQGHC